MPDWYLYVVRCQGGSLYTGIATDVRRRLAEHQRDSGPGSKYLRGRGPFELVFQKKIGSRSLALRLENKIKKLPKAKKEEFLKSEECVELILKHISP